MTKTLMSCHSCEQKGACCIRNMRPSLQEEVKTEKKKQDKGVEWQRKSHKRATFYMYFKNVEKQSAS